MTPRSLRLFVKKLQPKVGLGGYDILFAYFVVEAKSKNHIFFKFNQLHIVDYIATMYLLYIVTMYLLSTTVDSRFQL